MNETERAIRVIERAGIIRLHELSAQGVHPMTISRMVDRGIVKREGRGLYRLAANDVGKYYSLLQAAKRLPGGVICLLSALQFHELTTQKPFEVWMAIDRTMRRPTQDVPPLRIHYFSGKAFTSGIEKHRIEGVPLRIYNPAKTVADCFKFRYKIGIEVAIEALRDCLRKKKATPDEIWHFAKICRVARVIYPYMEALG